MWNMVTVVCVGALLLLYVFHWRSHRTGSTPISRHDSVFAHLPPGVIPGDPNAPIRKATSADVKAPLAVRFEPPQGVRPEQVGMLVDGKVQASDIAAAVLDLTVRGIIRLTPEVRIHGLRRRLTRDWLVTVLRQPHPQEVSALQHQLLRAFAWFSRPATLHQLRPALKLAMKEMRETLAGDPANDAWYPGHEEGSLTFGAMFGAGYRKRSALGAALRYQSAGFREFLATADGDRFRFEAGAGMFSRHLPWAVAYGVTHQWVHAFREAAEDAPASVATTWSGDLAWFADFSGADFSALADLGDSIGDLADGIGDLASDLTSGMDDAGGDGDGGGGDGGGDGGGGD